LAHHHSGLRFDRTLDGAVDPEGALGGEIATNQTRAAEDVLDRIPGGSSVVRFRSPSHRVLLGKMSRCSGVVPLPHRGVARETEGVIKLTMDGPAVGAVAVDVRGGPMAKRSSFTVVRSGRLLASLGLLGAVAGCQTSDSQAGAPASVTSA